MIRDVVRHNPRTPRPLHETSLRRRRDSASRWSQSCSAVIAADMALGDGIVVPIPRSRGVVIRSLVLDFNGTLALDGGLLEGVSERLATLSKRIEITIATADTFGTAKQVLGSIPVEIVHVNRGTEKEHLVWLRRHSGVAVIGNGRNDVAMTRAACLSIGVLGPEGASPTFLSKCDVVVGDACTALDLLANPQRLCATLRN